VSTAIYKPGQGYYTRMGTVLAVALLGLLGMNWLWQFVYRPIGGINPSYVAAGTCILVGVILTVLTYWAVYLKHRGRGEEGQLVDAPRDLGFDRRRDLHDGLPHDRGLRRRQGVRRAVLRDPGAGRPELTLRRRPGDGLSP
jgi:hypothetical protein